VEHKITPGLEIGGWVELPGGEIRPGDWVILTRQAALVNGARVRAAGGGR